MDPKRVHVSSLGPYFDFFWGYQGQKLGLSPSTYHFRGDLDKGKKMRPVQGPETPSLPRVLCPVCVSGRGEHSARGFGLALRWPPLPPSRSEFQPKIGGSGVVAVYWASGVVGIYSP